MTNENTLSFNAGETLPFVPACYRLTQPASTWRLATRNGELILQAGSIWVEREGAGIEWKDVPTVDLDEQEVQP
jgi:hypothetical protein